jgi:hypothetical protein
MKLKTMEMGTHRPQNNLIFPLRAPPPPSYALSSFSLLLSPNAHLKLAPSLAPQYIMPHCLEKREKHLENAGDISLHGTVHIFFQGGSYLVGKNWKHKYKHSKENGLGIIDNDSI